MCTKPWSARHSLTVSGTAPSGNALVGWTSYIAPAKPSGDPAADAAAVLTEAIPRYDHSHYMWEDAHRRGHCAGSAPGEEWYP